MKLKHIAQAPDDIENNSESDVKFELALYYSFPLNRKLAIHYNRFNYSESVIKVSPNKVFSATTD